MTVTTLFFAPHQDDELFTMGVAVARAARAGGEAACVLLTDGRNCQTRLTLADGGCCDDINDQHDYDIGIDRYSALRDVEFTESCRALGVEPQHIHLPDDRMEDGHATIEGVKAIMRRFVERYPDAVVCTHNPIDPQGTVPSPRIDADFARKKRAALACPEKNPYGMGVDYELEHVMMRGADMVWDPQHPDHAVAGHAALELFSEGVIKQLELFVEPYLLGQYLTKRDAGQTAVSAAMQTRAANPDECAALVAAADEYCRWDPANERFALGLHSARPDMEALPRRRPFTYSVRPSVR